MARKEHNEIKAGLFVLLAVALLLAVVVWLGASAWFRKPESTGWFYAKATSGPLGLKEEYAVMYNDVEVGQIVDVRDQPAEGRTLYVVEFYLPGFRLRRDANAMVASGLLGRATLAITHLGSEDSEPVDEANPIAISGGLSETIENFRSITDTAMHELDAKNKDSVLAGIKTVVHELEIASGKIAEMTTNLAPEMNPGEKGTIVASLKHTLANLSRTSDTVDRYVQQDLGEVLVNVRQITTSVLASSRQVEQILTTNRGSIDEMIDNMTLVSDNLRAAATEVRRNPWRLLYKPDEAKMESMNIFAAARAFEDGASQLDSAVTKLEALRGLDLDDPATKEEIQRIRTHLNQSFKQFRKVEEVLWQEIEK